MLVAGQIRMHLVRPSQRSAVGVNSVCQQRIVRHYHSIHIGLLAGLEGLLQSGLLRADQCVSVDHEQAQTIPRLWDKNYHREVPQTADGATCLISCVGSPKSPEAENNGWRAHAAAESSDANSVTSCICSEKKSESKYEIKKFLPMCYAIILYYLEIGQSKDCDDRARQRTGQC